MRGVQSFGDKWAFGEKQARAAEKAYGIKWENSCRCGAERSRTHAESTQPGASWRRERDSNRRYGIGMCRGDSVAILNKQKAAPKSGFLTFCC
jgi:hypothetical protein